MKKGFDSSFSRALHASVGGVGSQGASGEEGVINSPVSRRESASHSELEGHAESPGRTRRIRRGSLRATVAAARPSVPDRRSRLRIFTPWK